LPGRRKREKGEGEREEKGEEKKSSSFLRTSKERASEKRKTAHLPLN
jgi:hypothetical protein